MSLLLAFQGAPPAADDFITWVEAILEAADAEEQSLFDYSLIEDDPPTLSLEAELSFEESNAEGLTEQYQIEEDAPIISLESFDDLEPEPGYAEIVDVFLPDDDPILIVEAEQDRELELDQGLFEPSLIEDPPPPPDPNFLIYSLEAPETLEPPNHADAVGWIETTVVDEPPPILIPPSPIVRARWLSKTKFVFIVERR
jgi:hypothetical protein